MQIEDKISSVEPGRIGILLIHGLCGSPAEIRFVANGLTRAGYTVSTPTLAGHGGPEADLVASTWQDWYASAESALIELAKTCDRVIVGGLSTGAVLGLMLAARHPGKVQGLALYSPTLWLSGRQVPWYVPLFRLVSSNRLANRFRFPVPMHVGIKDQRIRDFIRSALAAGGTKAARVSMPGGAALERRRLADAARRELDRIAQPVLILHARDDDYAGLDNAAYLQRKIRGPVDLVVLTDCFHMVTIDRERHTVLNRTASFVSRIAGSLGGCAEAAAGAARMERAGIEPSAA